MYTHGGRPRIRTARAQQRRWLKTGHGWMAECKRDVRGRGRDDNQRVEEGQALGRRDQDRGVASERVHSAMLAGPQNVSWIRLAVGPKKSL
eukprot:8944861-Pyramimonas_sp.AAC.2